MTTARYSSDKDVNRECIMLVQRGWRIEHGGKHMKMYPPNGGPMVVVSSSPRGGKTLDALRGQVRRALRAGS